MVRINSAEWLFVTIWEFGWMSSPSRSRRTQPLNETHISAPTTLLCFVCRLFSHSVLLAMARGCLPKALQKCFLRRVVPPWSNSRLFGSECMWGCWPQTSTRCVAPHIVYWVAQMCCAHCYVPTTNVWVALRAFWLWWWEQDFDPTTAESEAAMDCLLKSLAWDWVYSSQLKIYFVWFVRACWIANNVWSMFTNLVYRFSRYTQKSVAALNVRCIVNGIVVMGYGVVEVTSGV